MRPVLACKNPWRFVVAGLRTGLKRRRLRRASTTCETNLRKQALVCVTGLLIYGLTVGCWAGTPAGKCGATDVLSRSASAPRLHSYKGIRLVRVIQHGRPVEVKAKVYHRRPDKTRTEYVAPPCVAGTIILNVGRQRWQYSSKTQRWVRCFHQDEEDHLALARRNYRSEPAGEGIVAGRPASVFILVPTTPGNPGKTIWVDKKCDLVVRSEWHNSAGEVISWSRFTEIEFDPPNMPDELFQPPRLPAQTVETQLDRPCFKVIIPGYVPKGYVLSGTTVLQVGRERAVHLKYTNGINTISLFERVELKMPDTPPDAVKHPTGYPSPQVVNWRQNGVVFTLMGDVSHSELRKIADSARK